MAGAELACGNGQREGDDRGHDAVVEPALDVEQPSQAHGHPAVVDHLRAQCRVGGRQRRPHETGERPGEVVQDQGSREGSEQDRERKPDPEQPCRKEGVSPELGDIHACRVREQQQRECHFGQQVHRGSVHIHRHRTPVGVPQHVARDQEDQGSVQVDPGQQVRDDGPPKDEEGNNSQRFLGHPVARRGRQS
jgi:hypothetical protein